MDTVAQASLDDIATVDQYLEHPFLHDSQPNTAPRTVLTFGLAAEVTRLGTWILA